MLRHPADGRRAAGRVLLLVSLCPVHEPVSPGNCGQVPPQPPLALLAGQQARRGHIQFRGQQYGAILLTDAMQKIKKLATEASGYGVVVEAKTQEVKPFYENSASAKSSPAASSPSKASHKNVSERRTKENKTAPGSHRARRR